MKFKAILLGKQTANNWQYFAWSIEINGEQFAYKTGLGNVDQRGKPTVPKLYRVIDCLICNSSYAAGSFDDFCNNSGYNTDSRKALDTYLQCQQAGAKLQRAVGVKAWHDLVALWNEHGEFTEDHIKSVLGGNHE